MTTEAVEKTEEVSPEETPVEDPKTAGSGSESDSDDLDDETQASQAAVSAKWFMSCINFLGNFSPRFF
jgi:hypothetical protein